MLDALPPHADVIIVGGGILGVAAAYWLARLGARPLVIERSRIGAGATGHNGGFLPADTSESWADTIRRHGLETARQLLSLARQNRALLCEIVREEEIVADVRQAGHLHLALTAAELAAFAEEAALLVREGVPAQFLDREAVAERLGSPPGPRIQGGLLLPEGGLANPARLLGGLAQAAARRGARFVLGEVELVEPGPRGVRIVTRAGSCEARAALVAVNAWTGTLVPSLAGGVTPVRGQVLATAPLPPVFPHGTTARLTPTEEYWQQLPDGRIILGGCRAVRPGLERGVLASGTTEDVQAALEGVLPTLFPALPPLVITGRWSGPMAFTPDLLPVVSRMESSCWAVGGFSGHGMALATVLGRLVASALVGDAPDSRLALLAPERLAGAAA
jgi:glycine/D-amino acid oxidase-like deaminating enzyme